MSKTDKQLFEFGRFRLDAAERLLLRDGVPIPLTPKSFDLLLALITQPGHLLEKETLLKTVWPDSFIEENNLADNIFKLRKALGEGENGQKFIETIPKRGYRFIATVTESIADESQSIPQVDNQPMTVQPVSPPVKPHDKKSALHSWWRKSAWGLAAVLLLAGAGRLAVSPSKEQHASPHAIKVMSLTSGATIIVAALSPDGKYFAYIEQEDAGGRLWLRQVVGGPLLNLVPEIKGIILALTFAPDGQAAYFVTYDQDIRQSALYRVSALGGPVTKVLTDIASPVTFAPDGQRLAFIRIDEKGEVTSLVLADLTGGNERIVLTHSGLERFLGNGPSWSPDGKEIACQIMSGQTQNSDWVCRVVGVDVENGTQRLLTAQQWEGTGRLAWLRDGSGLVMVGTKLGESGTTARDAVWFIAQPGGAVRRINSDLNRYSFSSLSVTDDGSALLVIPYNRNSQIWSVAARGSGAKLSYAASSAVQLTTGTGEGRGGMVSLDDGSLVYATRTGEHVDLWQIRSAGSQPQQLTTDPPFLEELSAPSDGRYLVFGSKRAGSTSHLFRVNRDGTNLRQLTSGAHREYESDCSPDGRWIVYSSLAAEPDNLSKYKLWKIPAEGGTPVPLTEHDAYSPHFSPDGQWISYYYFDATGRYQAVIIPAEGGAPFKTFELPTRSDTGCRWTPDGQALTFVVKGKTSANLWRQPLDGSAPHALTDFNSGDIYNYTFSRDGQQLFLARGHSIPEVVLIRDFQ